VHYSGGRFVAVGGSAAGLVFENDGGGWERTDSEPLYPLIGVQAVGADRGYAVGRFGSFVEERDGEWLEAEGPATTRTLHSLWVDPAGGLWAAGGELDVRPVVGGVLAYRGKQAVKGAVE
jgi:hypothetical protein